MKSNNLCGAGDLIWSVCYSILNFKNLNTVLPVNQYFVLEISQKGMSRGDLKDYQL